jgi:hypothetical protein
VEEDKSTIAKGGRMIYRLAADGILMVHLAFILFVLGGGAMGLWWRWAPVIHIPAAAWGFFVEITGRICPLTYMENYFRLTAGQSGYTESFIEHYLLDLIYPSGLTREIQLTLAAVVVMVNAVVYSLLLYRWRKGGGKSGWFY